MSVLTYGNVRMQIQKTESLYFSPVYTEDGTDYLYTEIDIAVTAVVNPQALATRGAGNLALGPTQAAPFLEDSPAYGNGDPVGVSLANLRPMLLTPRQALTFSINNNVVVIVPAGGDSRNGPLPQRDTYVRYILGTQTAFVYFHVKLWTPDFLPQNSGLRTLPRVVLANRYRVTSTMNEDYYTTRHISGQMIVDAAALRRAQNLLSNGSFVLTPDSFRQAAFLQIPTGFKRQNVQVSVSSDNTTLDYSYIDQETPLAFGAATMVTRIQGTVSTGISSPLNDLGGWSKLIAGAAGWTAQVAADIGDRTLTAGSGGSGFLASTFALGRGLLAGAQAAGGALGNTVANTAAAVMSGKLPKIVAAGNVRIWGQRNALKAQLMQLGIQIILDRLNIGSFFIASNPNAPRVGTISVSQDVVERFVEVNMTMISSFLSDIGALGGAAINVQNLQNWTSNVVTNAIANTQNPMDSTLAGVNPPPSLTDPTRGDWLGALVTALLATPGITPQAPADPAINLNQNAFF